MGSIKHGFENLPEKDFAGVYADLREGGWAAPAASAEEISRDDLVSHLRAIAGAAVKAVLTRNPGGLYKPDARHAHVATDLDAYDEPILLPPCPDDPVACGHAQVFSAHRVVKKEAGLTEEGEVAYREEERPSHLSICFRRLPCAPNALTAADVLGARE